MAAAPRPSWWPDLSGLDAAERAAALDALRLPELRLRYAPIHPTPKQEAFLRLAGLEVFFGGSAGPGKSFALLAAALQYVDVPGYAAILFRKTFPELSRAGGLIPRAHEWLDQTDARWNQGEHTWSFPSGASLTFAHLQHERDWLLYAGGEWQFVGFDELTTFAELDYRRLFSRIRRPSGETELATSVDGMSLDKVPLRMRAASNPGGPGHEWVRTRLVDPETREAGARFVPARLHENPHIDRAAYEATLAHLPAVERARLLAGDWDVRDDGLLFQRWWFPVVDETPLPVATVRFWDLAATEPSSSNPDPSRTCGLRLETHVDGSFSITDVRLVTIGPGSVEKLVLATATQDGRSVPVWFNQDPGQAGKDQVDRYRRLVLPGYIVNGYRETGSKLSRAVAVASAAENGLVRVLRRAWTMPLLDELEAFPLGHDDQVDALSGAHRALAQGSGRPARTSVPTGQLPPRGSLRR